MNRYHQHIIGYFGDESFQSITSLLLNDKLTRSTKRQNTDEHKITQHTSGSTIVALVNSTKHTIG